VRILPAHGDPHVMRTCPFTSSFADGLAVPMPTFPAPVKYIVPHPLFDVQYCGDDIWAHIGVPYVTPGVVLYPMIH